MAFSPDDRYFAATGADLAIAIDVANHTQLPLHGALSDMLTQGFAFLSPDRMIVQNHFDPKNSAVIEFPSGKVVERLPISQHQDMEAPTRGNYVILKPVKDALVGVLDLASQNFVIGSTKSSAIDVYDREVLTQRVSGEVGMFEAADEEFLAFALQKHATLVTLDADFHAIRAVCEASGLSVIRFRGRSRNCRTDAACERRDYARSGNPSP